MRSNMVAPILEGARPVFAEGKDRQRVVFLLWAHLSLGGNKLWIFGNLWREDGILPPSNFVLLLIKCKLKFEINIL